MNTTISATPAKLPSGQWGARAKTDACKGDTLTITTRGGKSWEATVTAVLPGGLLETRSMSGRPSTTTKPAAKPRRARSGAGRSCRSHGCTVPAVRAGYCAQCAFDEFDD